MFAATILIQKSFLSIEMSVEEQIRQAILRGEFDNLEGAGKPLNLDDYFATPEDVRVGYSILKSNNFVPEEVDRLSEIRLLKEELKNSTDEDEKKQLTKILNEKTLALALILERNKRKR
jgi:Domain of unknown function (DUF1992)